MTYNWKKNTVIFLSSQAISLFGSSLVQYAITWYIVLQMQSGIYTTLAIVFGILPMFFLTPFTGVWADRYNRKRLIVLADGGIATCTLIIAILFITGNNNILLLYGALFVRAVGGAVQTPCVGAMLPDMVPEEHLTRVNGINGSLQSLITLVSPMLSGALLGLASLEIVFFVDVATAAIAIFIMLSLFRLPKSRVQKTPEEIASQNYIKDLKLGLAYIRKNPYLLNFFVLCIFFFFMFAPVAFLTPLQVARNYGDDVWRLTAIEVAWSVGMMIGGLAIAAWGGFKNRVYTMATMGILMACFTIILGIPIAFWVYVGVMAVFGLTMPMFSTPAMVLLQERVDPAYMGRIFGVMTMINTGAMPMGILIFGPLADVVPIEWLLLGTGAVLMLLSLVMLKNRPLVAVGLKKSAPPAELQPSPPPESP
ncbi:MFS transporter [Ruminococcaceae bacterium OttesenSCG-928-I18]|nr:MFS transporter [Ruminococcaceae bacterium OttesenSCG-928-I18]